MTAAAASARIRVARSLDRSDHRKPLRLLISRRRAGAEQFVTQVRFGGAEAVVVPWVNGRPDPEEGQPA